MRSTFGVGSVGCRIYSVSIPAPTAPSPLHLAVTKTMRGDCLQRGQVGRKSSSRFCFVQCWLRMLSVFLSVKWNEDPIIAYVSLMCPKFGHNLDIFGHILLWKVKQKVPEKCPKIGHVLDMFWTHIGHFLGVWTYNLFTSQTVQIRQNFGLLFGHVLQDWTYFGHILDILEGLDMFWIHNGHFLAG